MLISVGQIRYNELTDFIASSFSGAALSGALQPYLNSSGYLGPIVVYNTGGDQLILGQITFAENPIVNYSGATGEVTSRKYIDDQLILNIQAYSGFAINNYFDLISTQNITGYKTFTNIFVNLPSTSGSAVPREYVSLVSGALQTGQNNLQTSINSLSGNGVVYINGTQTISGAKTFVISPIVPAPTISYDAVPKTYVDVVSGLFQTGLDVLSGGNLIYLNKLNNVNLPFFFKTVETGINLYESFVCHPFYLTGYGVGCINSGVSGYFNTQVSGYFSGITGYSGIAGYETLIGQFYSRDLNNIKSTLQIFTLNTGQYYSLIGGLNVFVSGNTRVGIDILNTMSGLDGLSLGIFGYY